MNNAVNNAVITALARSLLTRKDVAKWYQVHPETVRRWEKRGLKCIKVNQRVTRYKPEDVEQFQAEARA
jgi:predicted site-specific integrase-resolvase